MSAHIKLQIKEWCDKGFVKIVSSDYSGDILWSDSRFGGDLDFFLQLDVPFHLDTNGTHLTHAIAHTDDFSH
jgi:hypothetical protein